MTVRHQAMAARLMARYGGPGTISRTTPSVPDPDEPWEEVEPTITTYTVQLIEAGADVTLVAGGVVLEGDLIALMQPHPDMTPVPSDVLTEAGRFYTLLSAKPIRSNPTGPIIYFALHGRA